jgi:XTP/dITP diphosphohydrolase
VTRPLLIATTNPNKVREIVPVLDGVMTIRTLAEFPAIPEPAETGETFWANAREKALAYAAATGEVTAAEDSGLEIDALGGEPGVRSARYLGPGVPYADRFADIYRRLAAIDPRNWSARFITALAVADGQRIVFETEAHIDGVIAPAPAGQHGFGYDPLLLYSPFNCTTAEMSIAEKTAVSHRARAFRDLRRWWPTFAR